MQRVFIKYIFIILDFLWLIALFFLTEAIREALSEVSRYNPIEIKEFFFAFVVILLLFYYEKIYDFRFDFWQETLKIYKALFLSFLIIFSLLALSKTNIFYSRLFILIYFLLAFITFPIFKRVVKRVLFHFDIFKERLLVVGKKREKLIKELKENWYLGAKATNKNYHKVIIISNDISKEQLNSLIDKYLKNIRELFIIPYLENINFSYSNILEYSNIRYNLIQIENKLLVPRNIFFKNLADKLISLAIFPFFLLVHFIVSILIKIDSKGKVLFLQERLGKDGKIFKVYKYRTMYENSQELLEEYLRKNPKEKEYYEKYHKYKNDPRVTKIGKFLRKSSLDELPQILNVLKGEMSIVGPRPYMVNEKEKLINKKLILRAKPGITGLWQVSGRNNLTFKERINIEICYIRNWSLWLDAIILLKTIKVVFNKKGAY